MFLLDTNVISELRKSRTGSANSHVVTWAAAVPVSHLFLSSIVIHEIEIGIRRAARRDLPTATLLLAWLEKQVLPAFAGRILPVDVAVARRAAALHVPDPRPVRDALIAATALVHDMTMVTRDTGDFLASGVPLLNPWLNPEP